MRPLWGLKVVILWTVLGWQRGDIAVQSQITYPLCTDPALNWASNSKGQSPCEVAAILQGVCFDNKWKMDPIRIDQQYSGPSLYQSNPCQCNTVVYSLAAACGACQDGGAPSWSNWKYACSYTDVTVAQYPITIPSNTSVPAWAYFNVTVGGMLNDFWNQDIARGIAASNVSEIAGGSPPPTGVAKPLPSSPIPSSNIGPPGAFVPSLYIPPSNRTGAIVGGVVGGLVGFLVLVLVAFILYRKHRREKQNVKEGEKTIYIVGVETLNEVQGPVQSPSDEDPPKYADDELQAASARNFTKNDL